ncbi:mitochondrial carrier [Rhizophagus irregularis]|uniref:Mitochondrial carrier domain-containing protein n=3 Tax=Rhizophagus irregularis TaxID=588596 RepID=U9UWY4_RHIID|nr:mitochondrial carrier domain-containing protein [Rhizophagus irregularis DAOM 181602=DAOM 197198]EXX76302.1 Dic1p [Rhizophagus irregularis DAOM 197198w]PKC12577.1 mitochondrial carrier [Rhizophagus irregularis]PKC69683.1 mitochondrial carrier [Rhizophagus irregularis]PKY18210.1 mitochondrial carrier [Rhizophagus irregularis]PKY44610.1 mitochondrial carrier [Rhizophagus irregularis]|eukprot:XP_025186891.1 mitochondrial carrier domain-containing protein [Rhizophagus irregularis DAOM 181602=DAOM 197198]
MGSVKSNKIISLPSPSSASRRIEYPFWFGGAASCIACTVSHPLDLTKVRLQTTHGVNKASTIYTMIQIIKTEGILGLYSGLSASILRQITYSTMRFGVYDKLKNLISKNQEQLPFTKKILCASIAGSIGGAFGNPADLVMVRMQNDAKLPLENRRNYKHALDGLYRIVKEDGFRGLTRGIGPNVNRAILMNSSQLATYDQTKQMLLSTKIFKDNIITHFVSSVMAGLVATTVCSPVDVIKTRVMNSSSQAKSIMQVLSTIIRAEGPLALFKGWVPAFVRLGPHTVVTFMVLEQIKNLYDKRLAFKSEKASATLS